MTLAIASAPRLALGANRYRMFGGYRASLALAVVVSHSQVMLGPNFLQPIQLGNIAVMSFFVLSGFIISEAGSTFYRDRPLAFLSNRFLRIAPTYWLALAISMSAHFVLASSGTLAFPDDYAIPPHDLFSIKNLVVNLFAIFPFLARTGLTGDASYIFVRFAWAVQVEVIFYLAAFGCFCAVSLIPSRRHEVYGSAIMAALAMHTINDYWRPIFPALTFVPYFSLGVCLYGIARGSRAAIAGSILSFAATMAHYFRYAQGHIGLADAIAGASATIIASTLLMAMMPALIFLLSTITPDAETSTADRRLGDFSYPMYLSHYTILVSVVSLSAPLGWPAFVTAIIGSVGLSWMISLTVEAPMRSIRNRIRGHALDQGNRELR